MHDLKNKKGRKKIDLPFTKKLGVSVCLTISLTNQMPNKTACFSLMIFHN